MQQLVAGLRWTAAPAAACSSGPPASSAASPDPGSTLIIFHGSRSGAPIPGSAQLGPAMQAGRTRK
jgi:hypothetical protein